MSKAKVRNKKYKPGKIIAGGHLPPPRHYWAKEEAKALTALASIRGGFYNSQIGTNLIIFLTCCKTVISPDDTESLLKLQQAFSAINKIKDRHTRVGKWGVNGDELLALEESVQFFIGIHNKLNRSEMTEGLKEVNWRIDRIEKAQKGES